MFKSEAHNVFTEYSNNMQDVYKNVVQNNPRK